MIGADFDICTEGGDWAKSLELGLGGDMGPDLELETGGERSSPRGKPLRSFCGEACAPRRSCCFSLAGGEAEGGRIGQR